MTNEDNLHDVPPAENGRHPEYSHLVYVEVEPHYGMYLIHPHSGTGYGTLLWSADDCLAADEGLLDREYGYLTEDYWLDQLEVRYGDQTIEPKR